MTTRGFIKDARQNKSIKITTPKDWIKNCDPFLSWKLLKSTIKRQLLATFTVDNLTIDCCSSWQLTGLANAVQIDKHVRGSVTESLAFEFISCQLQNDALNAFCSSLVRVYVWDARQLACFMSVESTVNDHVANLVTAALLRLGFPPGRISEQLPRPSDQAASKSRDRKVADKHVWAHCAPQRERGGKQQFMILHWPTFASPDFSLDTFFFLLPAKQTWH